jgi:hypothetical protein
MTPDVSGEVTDATRPVEKQTGDGIMALENLQDLPSTAEVHSIEPWIN